ncbi:WD40-repeat-containing domain protein [Pelagophyceae sp. CCMP2097]|nr:WD40-repeat-containing domain protein [Pelagophyceae sp. CCMP2097]
MLGLVDYGDSDDDGAAPLMPPPTTTLARAVNAAPNVVGPSSAGLEIRKFARADGQMVMRTNLPASAVLAPLQGPEHPFRRGLHEASLESGSVHAGGAVDRANIDDWCFHEQFHTFQSYGYAEDAAGGGRIVGDEEALRRAAANGGASISSSAALVKRVKKKRPRAGPLDVGDMDVGDEDEDSVWAPIAAADDDGVNVPLTAERKAEIALTLLSERAKNAKGYDENEDFDRRDERKISHLLPPRLTRDSVATEATSTFHGAKERDYQGRSWTVPAPELRRRVDDEHDCFIPKKCVHRWTGHSKGVQAIRLFPKLGHLLLSASLDGSIKIWDVYNERECKRTYKGHSEAVRDVTFCQGTAPGSRFASCGFDRFSRVWDTETGTVLHTLSPNRKMCYCVDFFPQDENILLAGASDNRIYQWDLRVSSENYVQEYNHHLQPVNSITFIDDDKRFVSTSDDKKIFIWEHNIPVPMKYISEPHLNSVPVVELHPSGQFWCGQSMDNQIITYQAKGAMKQMRKKNFKGHLSSGFACGLSFSPNGRFLASGDGEGRLFTWDFKSTRVFRKMHAHDAGPCIGTVWHPIEPSWLVTCGWDGLIKLWD